MKLKNLLFFSASLILFSCSGKKEELMTEQMSDYLPLQPGKYITYRVDSLVFSNFGTVAVTNRYQIKHQVDAQVTDNLGRPSYRIYTYIRDSAGTQLWTPSGSYMITQVGDQTELTEDNYRVIKLHMPLKEGFDWHGNTYFPTRPYYPAYDLMNAVEFKYWDFTYDAMAASMSYRGNMYNNVVTVLQSDEHQNYPVTNVNDIGYNTLSYEQYSKSIGLVFRKYEIWDYQTSPTKHYTGFGVTQWMIDHN